MIEGYPNEREARQLVLAVKIGVVLGVIGAIAMILAYGYFDIQCACGQHWDAQAQECLAGARTDAAVDEGKR